jgi:hypothetical protein
MKWEKLHIIKVVMNIVSSLTRQLNKEEILAINISLITNFLTINIYVFIEGICSRCTDRRRTILIWE